MSESYLRHALNGAVLDQEQARSVFEQMSRGELSDIEIAAFLGALHARGEQPSEIAGAAEAFRQHRASPPMPPALSMWWARAATAWARSTSPRPRPSSQHPWD